MPIDHQKGILKKLTYANSKYDTYKMSEMLPVLQLIDPSKKKSEYNLHKIKPSQQLLFISKQLLDSGEDEDFDLLSKLNEDHRENRETIVEFSRKGDFFH